MSLFDKLLADIQALQREAEEQLSADLPADIYKYTELHNLEVGVMNTDQMNACRCFMVDFVGKGGGEVSIADVSNISDMIDRVGGSLASEVKKFLAEQRAHVTEGGGGVDGWHLGVYCTPGEAWLLFRNGRDRFAKALRSGILSISIIPWSIKPHYQGE